MLRSEKIIQSRVAAVQREMLRGCFLEIGNVLVCGTPFISSFMLLSVIE